MNNRRIFITGGCGFIGVNLVKYLLDRDGYDITVYDNLCVGRKENLDCAIRDSRQKGRAVFIKGDILNQEQLYRHSEGHNAIIHLAAHTRVVESLKDPKENFNENSIGTFNCLEAARKNRIKKFIFASSNAAVGEQIPPINEKMIPRPISPYGASKLHGEALCLAYFHSYGMKTIILRFANAYGPYSYHKTSVVAKFIKRLRRGQELIIYGDGNQTRDFIYADDVCQAIHLALVCHLGGEVFQIATGIETKIKNLARLIYDYCGDDKKGIIFTSSKKGEIRKNYSDIGRAKKILDFKPSVQLEQGLKKAIESFI